MKCKLNRTAEERKIKSNNHRLIERNGDLIEENYIYIDYALQQYLNFNFES